MLIKAMYVIIPRALVISVRLKNHPSGMRQAGKKARKQTVTHIEFNFKT